MRGYTQLTRDERYQIYALRKAGCVFHANVTADSKRT